MHLIFVVCLPHEKILTTNVSQITVLLKLMMQVYTHSVPYSLDRASVYSRNEVHNNWTLHHITQQCPLNLHSAEDFPIKVRQTASLLPLYAFLHNSCNAQTVLNEMSPRQQIHPDASPQGSTSQRRFHKVFNESHACTPYTYMGKFLEHFQ